MQMKTRKSAKYMRESTKFNGKRNMEEACRKNAAGRITRMTCLVRGEGFALLMQDHCGLGSNDCSLFATEQTLGIHYTVYHNGYIGFIVG